MRVLSPEVGTFTDMEDMDLSEKLQFLKGSVLKCNNKRELLAEFASTWRFNGLSNLKYEEINRKYSHSDKCVQILVDVQLNGNHWTDARSGISDSQLDHEETSSLPVRSAGLDDPMAKKRKQN